jgi:hypothetical protein
LKDSNTGLRAFLGFLLAGYRDVKEYAQKVGSPLLPIADIEWLSALSIEKARELITFRASREKVSMNENDVSSVLDYSGCHPYLIQQILNCIFDAHQTSGSCSVDKHVRKILRIPEIDVPFSSWWNMEGKSDGFGNDERSVYKTFIKKRECTVKEIATSANISEARAENALDVLAGTGVIHEVEEKWAYKIGCLLFEKWVVKQ